jgi:hypothetical protein
MSQYAMCRVFFYVILSGVMLNVVAQSYSQISDKATEERSSLFSKHFLFVTDDPG